MKSYPPQNDDLPDHFHRCDVDPAHVTFCWNKAACRRPELVICRDCFLRESELLRKELEAKKTFGETK